MLFSELLARHAHHHPARLAVVTNEGSITYRELDLAVNCVARHLVDRGLKGGDRVALYWRNSVECAMLMLGIWRAGLVVVPVNPRLKPAEIAYVLKHSEARLCFSEPELHTAVGAGIEVICEVPIFASTVEALPEGNAGAPAMILYTSGTTAKPKGVVHTQRTLLEGARIFSRHAPGSDVRPLAITQMAHIAALQCVFLPSLIHGASVVLLKQFTAAGALDIIERFQCTYVFSLPSCLQLMAEEQMQQPRSISTLQAILAGGDTSSFTLQRQVREQFHVQMQEACGMTEVLPTAVNPHAAVRVGSIGIAVNGVVRVVDSEGIDVERGDVGEMVIRSAANCLGYWNDPEASARLFEGGWLHTGDLVTQDQDGYLWFRGRLKQIIIRAGSNISPQEVEEVLYQHPAVLEAGVVGLPDASCGEVPVAFLALRAGCDVTADQLVEHTRALLADYKVPTELFFIDELPKGLTGKIDRRRLRDMLLADGGLMRGDAKVRV